MRWSRIQALLVLQRIRHFDDQNRNLFVFTSTTLFKLNLSAHTTVVMVAAVKAVMVANDSILLEEK